MKNRKEYGIYFRKGADCGIAKIVVLNITTAKYIGADNSESDTEVSRLVDTYQPASGYTTLEKDFVYWIALNADDEYEIYVSNSGTYNPLAASPYNMNIIKYFDTQNWVDGSITRTVRVWHSDHAGSNYDIVVTPGTTSLLQTTSFNGDGTIQVFSLTTGKHANEIYRISKDGGITWLYPSDPDLTWGNNPPDYDNESYGTDGLISVKFVAAPDSGTSNVKIQWYPKVDSYKVYSLLNQPSSSEGDVIDLKSNFRELDYSLEFTV